MSDANSLLEPGLGESHGAFGATRAAPAWPWEANADMSAAADRRVSAGGLSAAEVSIELHADVYAIEDEWRAFERTADATPFQSFSWASNWMRHIGAGQGVQPLVVLGRDPHGSLLFLLPLAIEPGRLRRLTWLGSALCDYGAPLLASDFEARIGTSAFLDIWRNLIDRLQGRPQTRIDLVDLPKMPERVGAQANPFLTLPNSENPSGAYVFELTSDWDALYAAKRSSSVRKQERKQWRRLSESGEIVFSRASGPERIAATMQTLFEQKSRSFAKMGVEDLFARPGYREFFRGVAAEAPGAGYAQVLRLDIGPTLAATNFGLMFRSCFYLILSSYDDGELSRFGPGRAHLRETIRHAIGEGCRAFDFTIGDEGYKRDWSDRRLTLHDHVAGVSARGRMVASGATAFRTVKRTIKQNPALWSAYSKARSRLGLAKRAVAADTPSVSSDED